MKIFEKNIYIKFSDSSVIVYFKIYYYTKDFSLQWLLKAHSLTLYTAIFNSKYLSIDNDYKYSFVMDFMQKLYDYKCLFVFDQKCMVSYM